MGVFNVADTKWDGSFNLCSKAQCRGRTDHSTRRHYTPLAIQEVLGTRAYHRAVCRHQCTIKASHSLVTCMSIEAAAQCAYMGSAVLHGTRAIGRYLYGAVRGEVYIVLPRWLSNRHHNQDGATLK